MSVRSAGVVPVRFIEGRPHYLVLRCFRYWDFPKGEVEPGEGQLESALREVAEETTLSGLQFPWGETYRETGPYGPKGKIARYYLAEAPGGEVILPVNPELGEPEHHEFRWLPYGEARRLLGPRVRDILEWAHRRVISSP